MLQSNATKEKFSVLWDHVIKHACTPRIDRDDGEGFLEGELWANFLGWVGIV